jgi:hypothetical protein
MRGLPLSATLPGLVIGLFQQSRNSHADWPRMGSLIDKFGRVPSDLFDVTPDGPGDFE